VDNLDDVDTGYPKQKYGRALEVTDGTYHVDVDGAIMSDDPTERVTAKYHYLLRVRSQIGASTFDQSKAWAPFKHALREETNNQVNRTALAAGLEQDRQDHIAFGEAKRSGDIRKTYELATTPAMMKVADDWYDGEYDNYRKGVASADKAENDSGGGNGEIEKKDFATAPEKAFSALTKLANSGYRIISAIHSLDDDTLNRVGQKLIKLKRTASLRFSHPEKRTLALKREVQGVMNLILKEQSGAAVTATEMERFMAAVGGHENNPEAYKTAISGWAASLVRDHKVRYSQHKGQNIFLGGFETPTAMRNKFERQSKDNPIPPQFYDLSEDRQNAMRARAQAGEWKHIDTPVYVPLEPGGRAVRLTPAFINALATGGVYGY